MVKCGFSDEVEEAGMVSSRTTSGPLATISLTEEQSDGHWHKVRAL
jgi:hypothetical protein